MTLGREPKNCSHGKSPWLCPRRRYATKAGRYCGKIARSTHNFVSQSLTLSSPYGITLVPASSRLASPGARLARLSRLAPKKTTGHQSSASSSQVILAAVHRIPATLCLKSDAQRLAGSRENSRRFISPVVRFSVVPPPEDRSCEAGGNPWKGRVAGLSIPIRRGVLTALIRCGEAELSVTLACRRAGPLSPRGAASGADAITQHNPASAPYTRRQAGNVNHSRKETT